MAIEHGNAKSPGLFGKISIHGAVNGKSSTNGCFMDNTTLEGSSEVKATSGAQSDSHESARHQLAQLLVDRHPVQRSSYSCEFLSRFTSRAFST